MKTETAVALRSLFKAPKKSDIEAFIAPTNSFSVDEAARVFFLDAVPKADVEKAVRTIVGAYCNGRRSRRAFADAARQFRLSVDRRTQQHQAEARKMKEAVERKKALARLPPPEPAASIESQQSQQAGHGQHGQQAQHGAAEAAGVDIGKAADAPSRTRTETELLRELQTAEERVAARVIGVLAELRADLASEFEATGRLLAEVRNNTSDIGGRLGAVVRGVLAEGASPPPPPPPAKPVEHPARAWKPPVEAPAPAKPKVVEKKAVEPKPAVAVKPLIGADDEWLRIGDVLAAAGVVRYSRGMAMSLSARLRKSGITRRAVRVPDNRGLVYRHEFRAAEVGAWLVAGGTQEIAMLFAAKARAARRKRATPRSAMPAKRKAS